MRAVATAALAGRLDAAELRAIDAGEALDRLMQISGIGPFSAQLVLARGAGHPDLFPEAESRLHEEMALGYGLAQPSVDQLAAIAANWRPYRTWVGLLFRTRREDETAEITSGRRNRSRRPG